jgi:ferredoxin-NADP reductase
MSESGKPERRASHRGSVERIFDHNSDTRSMFLRTEQPRRFVPGQFISISIPLGDETRTRAYSVAGQPEPNLIEICFNQVAGGRGVGWLFERVAGDLIEFTGPFGTFTMERAPEVETVLIAEETAIAPIRPMLHLAASAAHASMLLLYGATRPERILYRAELESIAARDAALAIETVIAPSTADLYRRLTEQVERRFIKADSNRTRQFYICGVGRNVIALRDLLRGSGYERRAVHYEQW